MAAIQPIPGSGCLEKRVEVSIFTMEMLDFLKSLCKIQMLTSPGKTSTLSESSHLQESSFSGDEASVAR